jgi:hypothetical protein
MSLITHSLFDHRLFTDLGDFADSISTALQIFQYSYAIQIARHRPAQ